MKRGRTGDNMESRSISKAVINRLPRYYRFLGILMDQGIERISSGELSKRMNVTASQIRQDLNLFGGFGQQGYGYNVAHLRSEIGKILGLDKSYNMIVIGAGRLGQAISSYFGFEKRGFKIDALFDRNPDKYGGVSDRNTKIYPLTELEEYLAGHDVDIAVLTIPSDSARMITPVLVKGGVRGIWNFAHTDLEVPDNVTVQSVHLSESLMQLSYKINH